MNIYILAIVLLMGMPTLKFANQINMGDVRQIKAHTTFENEIPSEKESDLGEPIDFETEGELSEEDLKKPLWVVILNKIVSPLFVLYNWFENKD